MAYASYGGSFKTHASLILQGKCHLMWLGDSQSISGRVHTVPNELMARLPIQWAYIFAPVGGNQTAAATFGTMNNSATNGTVTTYGGNVTDVTSGASTPALGAYTTRFAFTGDNADATWTNSSGGFQINRTQSDNTTGRRMPWPLLSANSNKQWYQGSHFKFAPVMQGITAGNNVSSFEIAPNRSGNSSTPALGTLTWTTVTLADTSTIQRLGWSSAHADAGNYQTSSGTLSTLNDHSLVGEVRPLSGVDETGKSAVFIGGLFARCDGSGVIPTNSDGSSPGFAWIGRSGSSIHNWDQTYWSQTQWQEFFAATVLNPTAVTVMPIMLGHNLDASLFSGANLTATHRTRWTSFLTKLRAAYAAAFPSGTLHIMLIMPWRCTTSSNAGTQTLSLAEQIQAEYEYQSSTLPNVSWFSFFNAFDRVERFQSLHSESESSGALLGNTLFDNLHRATNYTYHPLGSVGAVKRTLISRTR